MYLNLHKHITKYLLYQLVCCLPLVILAEPISLQRIDGQTEDLSNYIGQGQWVIVNVWSPSCSACVAELPEIKRLATKHPHLTLLGVTIDFPSFSYGRQDIIQQFLAQNPLPYPIFLADTNDVEQLIQRPLVGIPLLAIFHPDGRVLARWPGAVNMAEVEDFIQNYHQYINDDFDD